MEKVEATSLADKAVRLGLLTLDQVREGWDELGQRGGDVEAFLQVMERRAYLTPWQSSKLLKDDRDGYFLGGYRILYKIASGSFGRVYRASDPSTGRVVAIKVLRRKWSEDKHSIDLFEREGRVGMNLTHPNIVQILAISRDLASQQYYIVMEFIEGGNLRDFLVIRKKMAPLETIKILEEVASGLVFALSRGITHRDMKLTNILISSQGDAKLVDFGLAGVMGKWQAKEDASVDRTVDYAGLEKLTNVPHGDTRSDIYFLGCVAYEMLTGRPPLERSKNPTARMQKERYLNIPKIMPEEVGQATSLIRLVETMMSLNPLDRYQTPSQLLEGIREVRRELEGPTNADQKRSAQRTLFLAEKDERLQDVLRGKLKEQGYRVLIAADPVRAIERYRQQPFDLLVVDAGTTGEAGLLIFEKILADAARKNSPLSGILMLNEDQALWADKFNGKPNLTVMVQPIKLKMLLKTIESMLA